MSGSSLHAEEKAAFLEELAEWENINKLLKRHGCNPVCLGDGRKLSGVAVLGVQASVAVRCAVKSLVEDTERRQNLIHGLIQSNNQLKEDLRQQQGKASRQEQRAGDLQRVLDGVKTKIQALEDDFLSKTCQQQNQMKALLGETQAAHAQCHGHREQLREQEESITRLKKKLSVATATEEKRVARQRKDFLRFQSRVPRENNVLDQQKYQASDVPVRDRKQSQESLDLDTTPNYKALLKSYQEQVREAKEKIEQLVRENADIQEELASRPTCMELKLCVQQVRRLERIVLQNNLRDHAVLPRERSVETPGDAPSASATVQDIDHLPATVCRGYLQNLCRELGVQDVAGLVPAASAKAKQAETCAKLHKILSGIRSLLSGPRSPQLLYKPSNRLRESQNTGAGDESDFLHLLPTVEMWAGQLLSLRALHRSLRKLCEKLLPHRQTHETHGDSDNVRVEELLLLVDTMMEDVESEGKDAGRPSPHTLHALVSHFQTLFDVASVSGVFPRMNEVYSRLGEMSNAMRNQRCLLGLDDAATPGTLVNAVGRLCGEVEEGTSRQIQQLLGTLDIDSVINKLQEHDEFFPAFDGLIRALLEVLEIARLEEILPAVRRLKAPAAS